MMLRPTRLGLPKKLSTQQRFISRLVKIIADKENLNVKLNRGYFTRLVKEAKKREEIEELLGEFDKRFGPPDTILLATAAYTSAKELDDPDFSRDLLQRIPKPEHHSILPGILKAVLGCASRHKSTAVAQF